MDDLIGRIKARVADPIAFLDSASWIKPIPRLAPPVKAAEVDAAEEAMGFAFPLLLRRLYTEVGNGRWGPGYGFYQLPGVGAEPNEDDLVGFYLECVSHARLFESPGVEWPAGLVPIIGRGCVDYELCDFLSPFSPVWLLSGDAWDMDRPLNSSLKTVASSLVVRLEAWLDGMDSFYGHTDRGG
ncbi:MAG: hypothetical protein R3C53_08625 [Pirellulaceae bacterium]